MPASKPANASTAGPSAVPKKSDKTALGKYFPVENNYINSILLTDDTYDENPELINQTNKIVYAEPFTNQFYLLKSVEKISDNLYRVKRSANTNDNGVVVYGTALRNKKTK